MVPSDTEREKARRPGPIAQEVRRGLMLLGHQVSATFLVVIWTTLLTAMALGVPRLWGHVFRERDVYPLMTASPYYPMQIMVGVLWGWLRGFVTRERMMLWVWVCPLALLVIAILTRADTYPSSVIPGSLLSEYSSIRSYFFGRGCRPQNGCIEQLGTTLPSYASVAYSIGAWLALTIAVRSNRVIDAVSGVVLAIGLALTIDSGVGLFTLHSAPLWLLLLALSGEGALAGWLILMSRKMRQIQSAALKAAALHSNP
jgi:hypothetical protein